MLHCVFTYAILDYLNEIVWFHQKSISSMLTSTSKSSETLSLTYSFNRSGYLLALCAVLEFFFEFYSCSLLLSSI